MSRNERHSVILSVNLSSSAVISRFPFPFTCLSASTRSSPSHSSIWSSLFPPSLLVLLSSFFSFFPPSKTAYFNSPIRSYTCFHCPLVCSFAVKSFSSFVPCAHVVMSPIPLFSPFLWTSPSFPFLSPFFGHLPFPFLSPLCGCLLNVDKGACRLFFSP